MDLKTERELLDFIEMMSQMAPGWKDYYQFLSREGKRFHGYQPRAKCSANVKKALQRISPQIKMCYHVSQLLAVEPSVEAEGVRYYEGYAASVIPIEHAWCVDAEGRVLDAVLELSDRHLSIDRKATIVYVGVEVDTKFIRNKIIDRMQTAPVLGEWFHHNREKPDA